MGGAPWPSAGTAVPTPKPRASSWRKFVVGSVTPAGQRLEQQTKQRDREQRRGTRAV
jgi:hypothetical protein